MLFNEAINHLKPKTSLLVGFRPQMENFFIKSHSTDDRRQMFTYSSSNRMPAEKEIVRVEVRTAIYNCYYICRDSLYCGHLTDCINCNGDLHWSLWMHAVSVRARQCMQSIFPSGELGPVHWRRTPEDYLPPYEATFPFERT